MPGFKSNAAEYYGASSSLGFRLLCRFISFLQWVGGLAVFLLAIRFVTAYDFPLPKTFYMLIAVAGITLVAIPLAGIASWFHKLSPRTSLYMNIILSILWVIGFAIAAPRLVQVVFHHCPSGALLKITVGIHICRTDTIIFIGSIVGIVTSISAAFCDIVASRRIVPRTAHKYTPAYMSGSEVTSYQSREPLYDRQAGM